jgi:hypothetical protein
MFLKPFHEIETEKTLKIHFMKPFINLIPKLDKGIRKLWANFPEEHRLQNSQKNCK